MKEEDMYISKYFTLYEIELLRKLCAVGLTSDKFTDAEKRDIESMLENDLV